MQARTQKGNTCRLALEKSYGWTCVQRLKAHHKKFKVHAPHYEKSNNFMEDARSPCSVCRVASQGVNASPYASSYESRLEALAEWQTVAFLSEIP